MGDSTPSRPDQATSIRPGGHRRLRGWQVVALVALLLVGLEVVAESRGGSLDPTDPDNYNTFVLRNDLSRGVRVQSCRDRTCMASYDDGQTVIPGASIREEVAWGSPEPEWFLVTDLEGSRIGCLPLSAPAKKTRPQAIQISSALRCP